MSDEARGSAPRRYKKNKVKKSFKESFFPQKGDSSSEVISKLIVLLSIVVLIVCAIILGNYFYQMYEAKQNHNTLKVIYQKAQQSVISNELPAETQPAENVETTPEERIPLPILPAAQELLAINPNTIGYVRIPNCVDEPVVKGTDNEYYLNHNFYDNQRQCGTCFADYRNVATDYERSDNIILYAHNQKDGTMFGNLDFYADETYYQEHPFAYLQTEDSIQEYRIVTVLKADRDLFPFQQKLADAEAVQEYLKAAKQREVFETGDDYLKCIYDKVLTLVTCSYEWSGARNIVLAVPVSGAVWSQKCS